MKLIWYTALVLVAAAILFSGYTNFPDKKDQYAVEIIANRVQVHNANGYTIFNERSFDE